MGWKALVPPRKWVIDGPGWCLRYAQSFFGAPAMYNSAWEAWEHQQFRHPASEPLPDVPVLIWFEHWGTYGPTGAERYGNWGDVRIHVPGDAIYGAPITGTASGTSRVGTIQEIERGIGARYVGWSEDINGLRVAEPYTQPAPTPTGGLPMYATYWTGPTVSNTHISGRIVTDYGSFGVPNPQIMGLLQRRHDAALKPGTPDEMLDAEHTIINNYLRACFMSTQTNVQLDPAKLSSALTDALKKAGTEFVVDVDTEVPVDKLAAAFDQALPRVYAKMLRDQAAAVEAAKK